MEKGARVRIPEGLEVEVVEVDEAGQRVKVQLDETGNTFGWYPIDRVQAVSAPSEDASRPRVTEARPRRREEG